MSLKTKILAPKALDNLEEREVEIPDRCPHCAADLRAPFTLIENGFARYRAVGWLERANPSGGHANEHFQTLGFDVDRDHGFLCTGYTCAQCERDVTEV